MKEYRVVWQATATWNAVDGSTFEVVGSQKWRLYQVEHAAKRMLKFMTIKCGRCQRCAPNLDPFSFERDCPPWELKAWIEERDVGDWTKTLMEALR